MFHRHKWEWVAAQSGKAVENGKATDAVITLLLMQCRCGDLATRSINGAWSHEAFVAARGMEVVCVASPRVDEPLPTT